MHATVSIDTPGIRAVNVSKPRTAPKKNKNEPHLKFGFIISKQWIKFVYSIHKIHRFFLCHCVFSISTCCRFQHLIHFKFLSEQSSWKQLNKKKHLRWKWYHTFQNTRILCVTTVNFVANSPFLLTFCP